MIFTSSLLRISSLGSFEFLTMARSAISTIAGLQDAVAENQVTLGFKIGLDPAVLFPRGRSKQLGRLGLDPEQAGSLVGRLDLHEDAVREGQGEQEPEYEHAPPAPREPLEKAGWAGRYGIVVMGRQGRCGRWCAHDTAYLEKMPIETGIGITPSRRLRWVENVLTNSSSPRSTYRRIFQWWSAKSMKASQSSAVTSCLPGRMR